MRLLKTLRLLLLFFPFATNGQNVQENLQYINTQFEQFNKYQTSFDVDEVAKKIICRDKFGMYSAFLKDIEIKKNEAESSLEIFCIDESKCISSLKKDGRKGSDFSNYTIELLQNNDNIANTDSILEKFSFIKKTILDNDFVISGFQVNNLKYEVELQLQKLNEIFKAHAQNQSIWYFDWDNYWLVEETASCKVYIPLEKIIIDYYERENVQNFRHGFVFNSNDLVILKKCNRVEDNVSKADGYLDNLSNAEAAINYLKTIQKLVSDGPADLSPISSKKEIDQLLGYINKQFKNYNAFNTRFFVDLKSLELIWIQDFGESRAPIDEIDFKADYENGWVVIFCKNESLKCVFFANPGGTKFQYPEYSMSLIENDETIAHIDEVIEKFRELQKEIINN